MRQFSWIAFTLACLSLLPFVVTHSSALAQVGEAPGIPMSSAEIQQLMLGKRVKFSGLGSEITFTIFPGGKYVTSTGEKGTYELRGAKVCLTSDTGQWRCRWFWKNRGKRFVTTSPYGGVRYDFRVF
jgi:hypothetical protein